MRPNTVFMMLCVLVCFICTIPRSSSYLQQVVDYDYDEEPHDNIEAELTQYHNSEPELYNLEPELTQYHTTDYVQSNEHQTHEQADNLSRLERHDYVTEPSHHPLYKYEYQVNSPHTGDYKTQHEERVGDTVRGSYSLIEPDGSKRIVEYTADSKHGFRAIVKREPPSHPHSTPSLTSSTIVPLKPSPIPIHPSVIPIHPSAVPIHPSIIPHTSVPHFRPSPIPHIHPSQIPLEPISPVPIPVAQLIPAPIYHAKHHVKRIPATTESTPESYRHRRRNHVKRIPVSEPSSTPVVASTMPIPSALPSPTPVRLPSPTVKYPKKLFYAIPQQYLQMQKAYAKYYAAAAGYTTSTTSAPQQVSNKYHYIPLFKLQGWPMMYGTKLGLYAKGKYY